jgi:hypothetical protein
MSLRLRAILWATRFTHEHHAAALLTVAGIGASIGTMAIALAMYGLWSIVTDPAPWKFIAGAAIAIAWLVRYQ